VVLNYRHDKGASSMAIVRVELRRIFGLDCHMMYLNCAEDIDTARNHV